MVKRSFRIALLIFLAAGGGLVILLGISFAIGGYDWTMDNLARFSPSSLSAKFQSSGIARRWRCRNVQRPLLATTPEWSLEYSWTEGYGAGNIYVTIRSNRTATYLWEPHGEEPERLEFEIPADILASLAASVDETGFLCLDPLKRTDHQIVDLGTYRISVESDGFSRAVFAGQCHYVEDADAFNSVRWQVYALGEIVGRRLSVGPYGHTTISKPCDDGTS